MVQPTHDGVEIRDLGVDDVGGLVECVRRCYGESYTEAEFYDPRKLRREVREGRLLAVGALDGARVVGHIGARIDLRGGVVAETVGGVVDPDHRGTGLTRRIGARLAERYRDAGIAAAIHHATGAHDRTQRLIVAAGGVPTGVLLGHLAAGTEYRGIDHGFADARIGVVVYVQAHDRLDALDVHVPSGYAERVRDVYGELDLDRRVTSGHEVDATPGSMAATVRHDERRGISWLRFGALAGDGSRPAAEVLSDAIPYREIAYADVPIADPRATGLIELLRDHGFFFGAVVPGGPTTETLRLQRIGGAPIAPGAIVTASESGGSLLAWIAEQHSDAFRSSGSATG
jgi:GNAT superfamily N-acetyltransferase